MKSQTSESGLKKKDSQRFTSKYPILKWTLLILPPLLLLPLMVADIQVWNPSNQKKLLGYKIFLSTKSLFQPHAAARCAAVLLLMAVYWWVSHHSLLFSMSFIIHFFKIRTGEVLPLPITSLLPVILFPLLGIISTNKIAQVYMKVTLTKESSKITRLIVDRDQPWTVIKLWS